MSLNCEATELTPLRRSNHFQRPQQQQQDQEQEPHHRHPYLDESQLSRQQSAASALNHLRLTEFTAEYMSINNNNHPVGSDSSRADTSEPNSQQAFNPKAYIMSDTKRVVTRVTIDLIILASGESHFHFITSLEFQSYLFKLHREKFAIKTHKIVCARLLPFFVHS